MTEEMRKKIEDIRTNWAISDQKRDENLTVPRGIKAFYDLSYGLEGEEQLLDIYMQEGVQDKQPTIVNVHGGAWVYGSKEVYKFYCMSLALKGFTVVNINYRRAPEHIFPAPLEDVNLVMEFIAKNGEKYCIDKERLVIVGDSAGAQIVCQYAIILSNPEFAKLFSFTIPDITVRAVGLNCGAYNGRGMINGECLDDMFLNYLGMEKAEEVGEELLKKVDLLANITSDFPPAYVISTYTDFLLPQAEPMYQKLVENHVPAVKKIYGSVDRPEIGHVFHVNCNLEEAAICNEEECAFFRRFL